MLIDESSKEKKGMGNWKKQWHIIVLSILILSVLIMQFALMKQADKTIEARSLFLSRVQEKISEANSLVATENANRVLEEAADE